MEGVPAHGKGETKWALMSLPTQTILLLHEIQKIPVSTSMSEAEFGGFCSPFVPFHCEKKGISLAQWAVGWLQTGTGVKRGCSAG